MLIMRLSHQNKSKGEGKRLVARVYTDNFLTGELTSLPDICLFTRK